MIFAKPPRESPAASPSLRLRIPLPAHRAVPLIIFVVLGCGAALATQPAASGEGDNEAVAISSTASGDYVRARLANGSLQRETFAFAKGGVWRSAAGGVTDMLDFMEVARTIAGPLASQSYFSSKDPKATKLLIMVYWGTTRAPEHSTDSVSSQNLQDANAAALAANHPEMVRFNKSDSCAPMEMQEGSTISYGIRSPGQIDMDNALTGAMAVAAAEDSQRTRLNAQNAGMLGYGPLWDETARFNGTPLQFRWQDLMRELETRRYFVVLMAYDFQMMWKEKKAKLLWEARFSVRERGNDFSKELAAMVASAAPYFGKNSGKLIHKPLPEGHVEVGAIRTLAYDQQK
jgi:hypothetical protein